MPVRRSVRRIGACARTIRLRAPRSNACPRRRSRDPREAEEGGSAGEVQARKHLKKGYARANGFTVAMAFRGVPKNGSQEVVIIRPPSPFYGSSDSCELPMPAEARPPVKFENPPVVEVVAGVSFKLAQPLQTVDIGSYWNQIRINFPNVAEAAPIQNIVEGSGLPSVELQMLNVPPLRRVWFSSANGQRLLQLQDDRFLFNWKRLDKKNEYPSFDSIFPEFLQKYEEFKEFLKRLGRGDLNITQLELTYVNIFPLEGTAGITVLSDHVMLGEKRFLPEPESFQWNTSYKLPDDEGRLHVSAQKVHANQDPSKQAIRYDLVARGLPKDVSWDGQISWFKLGHEWITRGFADTTSKEAQTVWKRVS